MSSRVDISQLPSYQLLTPEGRKIVDSVRNSPPVRRVTSRRGNVCGRFPSRKMGHTVQYDSRHVENVYAVSCEYSEDVLEYWDQPTTIKIKYRKKNERMVGHLHTPDFLVIENDAIYLVECKTTQELEVVATETPARYCKNNDGIWVSHAGIEAASVYGMGYRVKTPET